MLRKDVVKVGRLLDKNLNVKEGLFKHRGDLLRPFGPQESIYSLSDIVETELRTLVEISLQNKRRVICATYLHHDNIVDELKEIKDIAEESFDLIQLLDWLKNNPADEGGESRLIFLDVEEKWLVVFHFDGEFFTTVELRSGRIK